MNLLGSDFFGAKDGTTAAHQLVDFTPIQEADQVLEECQMFLQQAGDTSFTLFPLLTRVSTVKNWRMKRRDNRLISVYETLYPRIVSSEKKLRTIMGEVVGKKADIREQARHLQARLQACIRFNKAHLQSTEGPVEELRLLINKLSSESALLKEMIEFNKELLRFGTVEKVSKGQSFVRWTNMSKAPAKKVITEAELQRDEMHPEIEKKLVMLRKLKEKFVLCLASVLEARGTQLANLDNCEHSLRIINSIVNRSGVMAQQLDKEAPPEQSDGDGAVISSPAAGHKGSQSNSPVPSRTSTPATPTNNPGNQSPSPGVASGATTPKGSFSGDPTPSKQTPMSGLQRTLTFDHGRCTDCAYGYMKTCDCTNHLNALQKQSTDANDRLQQLVEMRERVYEEAEKLIAQQGLDPSSLGVGSKSGSGSSFSEMFAGGKKESPSASPVPTPDKEKFFAPSPTAKNGSASEGIALERGGVDAETSEIDVNQVVRAQRPLQDCTANLFTNHAGELEAGNIRTGCW